MGDFLLSGVLPGIPGQQCHDVVVIDKGGVEEHELEFDLFDCGVDSFILLPALTIPGLASPLPEAPGGFEVNAVEGTDFVFGKDLLDLLLLFFGEIGILIKLRLEPLYFLELINELAARGVALEIIHLVWFGYQALGLHKPVEVSDGFLEAVDDDGCLVDQPDLLRQFRLLA